MRILPILLCAAVMASAARAQFLVRTVVAPSGVSISDIGQAEALLASQPTVGSGIYDVINFVGSGSDADFPGGVGFPGLIGSADDFAVEATGYLGFLNAGTYVFQLNSDAGFRLRLANSQNTTGVVFAEFTGMRNGPGDTDSIPFILPSGTVGFTEFSLTYFERSGGEELEFSYSLNGGPQQLVGSTSDITVFQVPEPGALTLAIIGSAGFAVRRRRSA